jgi:hypothetical protein
MTSGSPKFVSVFILALWGCTNEAEPASDTSRGASGGSGTEAGGSTGSPGPIPQGGMGGAALPTGGAGGAGGSPSACANGEQQLDPSVFPECPSCIGQPARCVPTSVVEQQVPGQLANLAPCDAESVCVPDVLISTLGNYTPPNCSSIEGAAGRCLSVCIGAVANLESFLPQDTCSEGEKCAPCNDPRTGAVTGACSLPCDDGPHEPSVVFSRCCGDDSGICVSPNLVPADQAAALAQDSCGDAQVCAPEVLSDSSFSPPKCESVGGAEGRCLSTCVGLVAKESELLPKDVCSEGELCAPCTDPRSGELTAACTINGDAPTEEPVIFDSQCCAGTGLCVPKEAVPDRYLSLLPAETCAESEGEGWVCAPTIKLNDLDAPFPPCPPLLPGPTDPAGACIPQCIADAQIAENPIYALDLVPSPACEPGWVCAPCENPLDGTRTGACD